MKSASHAALIGALLFIGSMVLFYYPERPPATEYKRIPSRAVSPAERTALKDALDAVAEAHGGRSGFRLLTAGDESLLLRIAMIQAAERSLDIQYYTIEKDMTGKLLLEAIRRAADHGVRVRLLMDDLNRRRSDPTWVLLNAHRNIEIRIFNPFATRDTPVLARVREVITGLERFNKRMHNKMLIADNQVAVTGGRNLSDPYFDAGDEFNFRDVDVLAAGPIVARLSASFDQYWNDDEAFPVTALLKPQGPADLFRLREELRRHWREQARRGVIVPQRPLPERIREGRLALIWAHAELAVDAPWKVDASVEDAHSKPGHRLNRMAAAAKREFIIVSPYFIPGEIGTEGLAMMVAEGVKVRVLTNSLASTDVVAVHAGYRRYRRALVENGVELYEAKPVPGTRPRSRRFSSSSRDSLHSKVYVVDRREVMIGSFNFDPRSINLNTEMGLVIHSEALATQVTGMFEKAISPAASYRLVMRQDGRLEWVAAEAGREESYRQEPKAGFWRRLKADLFSLPPLEDHL